MVTISLKPTERRILSSLRIQPDQNQAELAVSISTENAWHIKQSVRMLLALGLIAPDMSLADIERSALDPRTRYTLTESTQGDSDVR
jgi:hypothetical protein